MKTSFLLWTSQARINDGENKKLLQHKADLCTQKYHYSFQHHLLLKSKFRSLYHMFQISLLEADPEIVAGRSAAELPFFKSR